MMNQFKAFQQKHPVFLTTIVFCLLGVAFKCWYCAAIGVIAVTMLAVQHFKKKSV